jgi:hypothetical protein
MLAYIGVRQATCRMTGYTEITRLVASHKMFFGISKRVRCGFADNPPRTTPTEEQQHLANANLPQYAGSERNLSRTLGQHENFCQNKWEVESGL